MTWTLRIYDEGGNEIGWMQAIHDEEAKLGEWGEPYRYEWGVTNPASGEWNDIEATLRSQADPVEPGAETVECEKVTLYCSILYRRDEDGPEDYLREVANLVEIKGAARTTVESE